MESSTRNGEQQKDSTELSRRVRLRLCAVCGMKKHQHYMQTFTENAAKRFICYDHFTADQFEYSSQRSLILKRTAAPVRYDPVTFKPNRHTANTVFAVKRRSILDEQPAYINLLQTPPQISSMEFLLRNIEVYSFGKIK
nr:unnamed protein product [Haemonchus contortus]